MKYLVTMNWTKFQITRLNIKKRRHRLSKSERAAKARNFKTRDKAIDALEAYVNR